MCFACAYIIAHIYRTAGFMFILVIAFEKKRKNAYKWPINDPEEAGDFQVRIVSTPNAPGGSSLTVIFITQG